MKKSISILLSLVMVLSVIGTFAVTTSAANDLAKSYDSAVSGDLLYDVKFGQTEGAYQSAFFKSKNADPTASTTVTVSNGGKNLTINHAVDNAKVWYGGAIEGLTIGEGKQYTLTMKVKIPTNPAKDKSLGIFFNFPESFANEALTNRPEADAILGYYGKPDEKQSLAREGSTRREGLYICNGQHYVSADIGKDVSFSPDTTGFYDFAFEVDGYSYTLYINNTLFDTGYFDKSCTANKIGLSFVCVHDAIFEVKDAKVYKGLTKKNTAIIPDYVKNTTNTNPLMSYTPSDSNKLLKTYAEAANGELLYKVKFNATEGVFVPGTIYDIGLALGTDPVLSVSTTEDSVTITRMGESNATRSMWGDSIEGLKVSADTTYTLTYKIKANNPVNMGIGFITNPTIPMQTTQNIYGLWTKAEGENAKQPELNVQQGYEAIKGDILKSTARVPMWPTPDADGFTKLAIVVEGYRYSIYIWSSLDNGTLTDFSDDYDGWILFETFDTSTRAIVPEDLCLIALTWNTNLNLTIKDACIYKGLGIDLDEGKPVDPTETTPAETEPAETPAPETQAPETQAPATQAPATQAPATAAPKAEGGCGSVIGGGIAVIAIVSLAGVMLKKRD